MTHPLTDEMIQSIWDKVGNDIVDATDEELAEILDPWDDLMRTAYDLGESKGRADRLDEVIELLEEKGLRNYIYGEHAIIDMDEVIADLKKAMRPQVVDLPQANSDVCGEEGMKRARQQTFDENDELMRKLSDS